MLLLLTLGALQVNAQSFKKGQVDINLGVGLGDTYTDAGGTTFVPPISMSIEAGITNDISLGGFIGFSGNRYIYSGWEDYQGNTYAYTDTYTRTYLIVGVRGAYHFGRFIKIDKLDVYAGLMLGNDFANQSYTTTSPRPDHNGNYYSKSFGGFVASPYVGARYRFTDHFGVFLELGYGVTVVTTGLNFKF
jgi:phospholipase/lecithinase/hemolysin